MRRDDDLVRGEEGERVESRLQRVGVADHPFRVDVCRLERRQAGEQPLRCTAARLVAVRQPVAQTVVERGRDDEDLAAVPGRRGHRLVERSAAERLVCDHEDPPGTWLGRADGHGWLLSSLST